MLVKFIRASHALARGMAGVAGVALVAVMLLVVANILFRLAGRPFNGTFEIVAMLSVVVFGLALADEQAHHVNVSIDILVRHWSKRVRILVGAVTTIASVALFVQVTISLGAYGLNQFETGTGTDGLRIPYWPSVAILTVGLAAMVLVLLADLAQARLEWKGESPETNVF